MPGEGLHIPVDADDAAIRKLAAALRNAKKEAVEAAKAIRGVGAAAGAGGGGNGAHAPGRPSGGGQHHGILHGIARLTRGTEFGHLAHMGANVQGFGAGGVGMMALGAGIGVAVVGLKMLAGMSEKAAEAAKREVESRQEMTHAIRDSIKAADAKAVGAYSSNQDAIRSLAGSGGDAAVKAARKFGEETGPGGIKAYAAIANRPGGFNASDLEGAKLAASTGQISVEKAAEMISSGKVRSGIDPQQQAAAIISQESGQRITASDVGEMSGRFAGSKTGQAAERFERNEGVNTSRALDRFVNNGGTITAGQLKERADISNPAMAAQVEVYSKLQEAREQIQAQADAQYRIVALFEEATHAIGMGSGSYNNKLRENTAAASP